MSLAQMAEPHEGVQAPEPGEWKFDASHTTVGFVARYLMLTKVRGRFDVFDGTIHIAEKPEDSRVEVTIDASSINTNNADRDKHLRSDDFLAVEQYPSLTFRSTKVERMGGTNLRVEGDLTIRDQTRPVVLDVEYLGLTPDPWGRTRSVFAASTEIDRTDFGANWNMAVETGGVLVGKQVQIELEVQALKA